MDNQEREIKLYIKGLPAVAERLRLCGAETVRERTLERNFRFDTPDNQLKNNGRLLRLRKDDHEHVTYKDQAKFEEGIIVRREIEFTVNDFESACNLFEALGYQVTVIYEKYRSIFRLGEVVVALDELPYGDFIEIEAPNNTLIGGVAQMLGLDGTKAIQTNYLGLFERLKENLDLTIHDLTFKNFRDIENSPGDLEVEPADRF